MKIGVNQENRYLSVQVDAEWFNPPSPKIGSQNQFICLQVAKMRPKHSTESAIIFEHPNWRASYPKEHFLPTWRGQTPIPEILKIWYGQIFTENKIEQDLKHGKIIPGAHLESSDAIEINFE